MSVGEGLDGPTFYTLEDIAKRWGVRAGTVRACIRSEALEAFRVGPRLLRVRADKLAEYEAQEVAEAARPKGPAPLTAEQREAPQAREGRRKVVLSAMKAAWARGRKARG